MEVIDAKWTPTVNYLLIRCKCGEEFWHRADRFRVRCSGRFCSRTDNLSRMREVSGEEKKTSKD